MLAVLIVALVFFAAPGDGLRKGDEVRILGMASDLRAKVLETGGKIHSRPAVRLRIDNGPNTNRPQRFEEMLWPVDELVKVEAAGTEQTR